MASAFSRLHRDIQKHLWDMNWTQLYPFQVHSIDAWFDSKSDIILMAKTAAGKTEAAFLPILSSIAEDHGAGSIRVLYVGPLKALINDQFRRLEELCKRSEIPVHRWHGDVDSQKKKKLLKSPSGILLITPESLQSLLMSTGLDARRVFNELDVVVIDELHVFLDNERGRQLCCLLNRVDDLRKDLPRSRRVGLSATIGDPQVACQWLSGALSDSTSIIRSSTTQDIELLVKTLVEDVPDDDSDSMEDGREGSNVISIANHLIDHCSGNTNLVFCNRKMDIEYLADILIRLTRQKKIPDQFIVHHGSLSRQIRENAEQELKSGRPCTAICSSTLELGIDIGHVDAVGQIGPPHSVSALKQRMGRSGRKEGKPSRLYFYVPLKKCPKDAPLPQRLYPELVQALSMVLLMTGQEGFTEWTEPPEPVQRDFSTMIQQIMSVIVERGGIRAEDIYRLMNLPHVFGPVSADEFSALLKDLGSNDLIEQTPSGDLILGLEGEKVTSHYDFFAAFETPVTYKVFSGDGLIGEVEGLEGFYQPGSFMLLGGKRWKILSVNDRQMKIHVERAYGKKMVYWRGVGGHIHGMIRQTMYEILYKGVSPAWLEPKTKMVLDWAITEFQSHRLGEKTLVRENNQIHLFTWAGSRANHALYMLFRSAGFLHGEVQDQDIAITIKKDGVDESQVISILDESLRNPPEAEHLCEAVFGDDIPPVGKYGKYLSNRLCMKAYCDKYCNIQEMLLVVQKLIDGC